jgi:hypothetical protein
MEKWYDPTTWFSDEPKSTENNEDNVDTDTITDSNLLSAIDSGRNLLDIASTMSDTPIDTSTTKDKNKPLIKINLMDDIKLDDPYDGKTIKKGGSIYFNVFKVINEPSKTILILDGEHNKSIPSDLQLIITIPYTDGLNYKNDVSVKVQQLNKRNGDKEDLNDINLRILSH